MIAKFAVIDKIVPYFTIENGDSRMKRSFSIRVLGCIALLATIAAVAQSANDKVQVLGEDKLKKLLPASVFLDGENVPTQQRNAALVQLANGKLMIASLIDTAGYSAAYQQKYIGMLLSQTSFALGSKQLDAGAYGFGRSKNEGGSDTVHVYNLGGEEVAQLPTEKQENLRPLKPLQVIAAQDGSARLYLGPYYVAISGK
jgi:hypothetical protein